MTTYLCKALLKDGSYLLVYGCGDALYTSTASEASVGHNIRFCDASSMHVVVSIPDCWFSHSLNIVSQDLAIRKSVGVNDSQ